MESRERQPRPTKTMTQLLMPLPFGSQIAAMLLKKLLVVLHPIVMQHPPFLPWKTLQLESRLRRRPMVHESAKDHAITMKKAALLEVPAAPIRALQRVLAKVILHGQFHGGDLWVIPVHHFRQCRHEPRIADFVGVNAENPFVGRLLSD